MKLALADVDEEGLKQTSKEVLSIIEEPNDVLAHSFDVANLDEVLKFKEKIFETWDEVQLHFFLLKMRLCADALTFVGRSLDE